MQASERRKYMYLGAAYYPEHWTEEMWEKDARLMKEANFNVVRMAEFAWAKLEPQKGRYDFSWLDKAIGILSQHGISVILGTPTATPPKWLMDQNEDIYQKDKYGRVRGFGSRRHYCLNNPRFVELTKEIVSRVAEHYKDSSSVVAWQIDNEFGCQDTTYCYCEHCLKAFQKWLQNKYGSIDRLNEEWGTVFWSQTYHAWDEIVLPAYSVCDGADPKHDGHNPSMVLDYKRFSSHAVVSYQRIQHDILRSHTDKPITHNLMGHFPEIDYFHLGKDLDFVSWDNYPDYPWDIPSRVKTSAAHDLMRGIKGKNFWVMEQQSGPCGWDVLADTPKPGQLRLWTYQAVAHGAEGMVYFRFRACRVGAEQYWYGILDHDSVPRRRYREIQQTCAELKGLSHLLVGSSVVSEAAIVKSYDNLWSHQIRSHNANFDYNQLLLSYYTALAENNISADFISEAGELSKYKVLFMPAFNLMTESIKELLENYVAQGGSLVLTFRSGTRTWNNAMSELTLPGLFKEMAGVEVEEFDSLNYGRQIPVSTMAGGGHASVWCDILKPISANALASYTGDYYAGRPAITVNRFGKGKVYYIGCDLDPAALKNLVKVIAADSGIVPLMPGPVDGVEAVQKEKDGKRFILLLNYNAFEVKLPVQENHKDMLSQSINKGVLTLPPFGVALLTPAP